MEMHLFDKLTVSLGRLYSTVPIVLGVVYEEAALEGMCYFRIIRTVLYKYVLLILDILGAVTRNLAHFLHFDPPTFDTYREAARVYLKPDSALDMKQREALLQAHVAQLQDKNLCLAGMNADLSRRLSLAESRSVMLEASLSNQVRLSRQQSSLGNRPALLPLVSSPLLESRTAPAEITVAQSGIRSRAILQERYDHERHWRHLLVSLLLFRYPAQEFKKVVLQVVALLEKSQTAHNHTVQSLIIELLAMRRAARKALAESRMKTSLAKIVIQKQREGMQKQGAENENTINCLLIETLRLRKHLSPSRATPTLLSIPPAAPLSHASSMDSRILINELESLRLSEAQARVEKDSMAKCLSDVLASFPITAPSESADTSDEPIVELVLALAFMWKLRRRISVSKPRQVVRINEISDELAPPEDDVKVCTANNLGPHILSPIVTTVDAPSTRWHLSSQTTLPKFPPGIPLPSHLNRYTALAPDHPQVSISNESASRTYPRPICPPQRTSTMSRGGSMYLNLGLEHDDIGIQ